MAQSRTDEWTNVSTHAVTLASGRPLAPGESGPCDMKDPHDRALRDDGHLTRTQTGKEGAS